jgi:hypothetical protein
MCADGFPSPDAPLVASPHDLRFERQPNETEVFVRRGSATNFKQQPVMLSGGVLGTLPSGEWDYLLAMVRYDGGSVMYAWRLR